MIMSRSKRESARRITRLVRIAALIALAASPLACRERVGGHFATYADAQRAELDVRGWLPHFVPSTATEIWEEHDLDTNEQWMRFTVPPNDTSVLVGGLSVDAAKVTALYIAPPSGLSAMPDNLKRPPTAALLATEVRVAAHPRPDGQTLCVLLHRGERMAYVWTCRLAA